MSIGKSKFTYSPLKYLFRMFISYFKMESFLQIFICGIICLEIEDVSARLLSMRNKPFNDIRKLLSELHGKEILQTPLLLFAIYTLQNDVVKLLKYTVLCLFV